MIYIAEDILILRGWSTQKIPFKGPSWNSEIKFHLTASVF